MSEREDALRAVDQIVDMAEADDRDLSEAERELISRHHARVAELDPQIELHRHTVELQRAAYEATPLPARRTVENGLAPDSPAEVYRTYAQYARDVIVSRYDAVAQLAGGGSARQAAAERVSRAVAHTLTTDVPGLLPAQYLTQITQVISSIRPIVQSVRNVGLTNGKLSYPWITQRPLVGKQTAEKTEAPSRKMLVEFRDVIADTYAGAGNLSWQAINWSTPDALTLWFDLAAEEYARQTEAAAGTVLATAAAGPTVGSDDLEGWMAAITEAAGAVYAASRRPADTVWADIATGYHLAGLVSQSSPVFLSAGSISLASGTGNVAGLRLVVSPGLAAATVVVGAGQSMLVAETPGAPVELRAVEPAIGGMEVGVIGAFAAKITETAAFQKLTAPVGP